MIQCYIQPLKGVCFMENLSSMALFNEGYEDSQGNRDRPNYMNELSVFYRLGALYGISQKNPTRLELIDELLREFSLCKSDLPNYADFVLSGHYSHRMLRRTFDYLGYRLPPNRIVCSGFHAWRVR